MRHVGMLYNTHEQFGVNGIQFMNVNWWPAARQIEDPNCLMRLGWRAAPQSQYGGE